MSDQIVVLITVPSTEVGRQIAGALLEQKLAACVNISGPITSLYIWEGSVADDEEYLLLVKTRADIFAAKFVPAVEAVHPYDVPEIIALPIVQGNQSYLDWIDAEVSG